MNQRGFTMLELALVALVVAGILLGIALPSYEQQVRKARRSEAIAPLLQVQLAQERYRARHIAYAPDFAVLGLRPASNHYAFGLKVDADDRYTVTADAVGAQQADVACRRMWISEAGAGPVQAPADCW